MLAIDLVALVGFFGTMIAFLFSIRYYLFTFIAIRSVKSTKLGNPGHTVVSFKNGRSVNITELENSNSFVSVLLPVYNEPNVIDRLMKFCTSFNFSNYEVIVANDSTDETTSRLEKWKENSRVKVIQRTSRKGWKGGALNFALKFVDPRSTHVLILDADFVPPNDLLQRFLVNFTSDKIAVVQGRQVYDLNDDENFLTKGYAVLTVNYQLIEMTVKEKLNLLIPITGSVFMMRTDILKKIKFDEDSITEDWSLAMRLYEAGYKIVFDPSITASGECPNTLLRFFGQTIRWSEGIVRDFRKLFWRIIRSKALSWRQKLEFIYMGAAYLNSLTFIIPTTISGIVGLTAFKYVSQLPYTRYSIAFALIGIASIAISSAVALSINGSTPYNVPYALALGYIVTPITAYASLKGLFFSKGSFNRTYKTGKITRSRFYDFIRKYRFLIGPKLHKPFKYVSTMQQNLQRKLRKKDKESEG